jgi:hypothetical protein
MKTGIKTEMLILPNDEHGFYLKFLDENGDEWFSLENRDRMAEWAECCDEWYASIGLFVPRQKAWIATKEFCLTGKRTEEIAWITPEEMPAGSNW